MRSAAEQEIRDKVVERLRALRPGARIVHELNSAVDGRNRFDVAAVGTAELILCEIKSEKDKLDRAPDQIKAMRTVAHHVILALHETFLVEIETNAHNAEYERDGQYLCRTLPDSVGNDLSRARGLSWVYPEKKRARYGLQTGKWTAPTAVIEAPLPQAALDMLWRDELFGLCTRLRVSASKRSTRPDMISALRWHCSGAELTKGICTALRHRPFAEADDPKTE